MSNIKLAPERGEREFKVLFPASIANRIRETARRNYISNAEVIRALVSQSINETIKVRDYKLKIPAAEGT